MHVGVGLRPCPHTPVMTIYKALLGYCLKKVDSRRKVHQLPGDKAVAVAKTTVHTHQLP